MTEKQEVTKRTGTAFDASRSNVFWLDPWTQIDLIEDPKHPLYDERIKLKVSEAMIRSILRRGVLEPVLIRKVGQKGEVMDGRQRVKAAREATRRLELDGKPGIKVPCVLRREKDADVAGIMVEANEIRKNDDPATQGRKAQRLLDHGHSLEDIAEMNGVSVQTIEGRLRLLDSIKEVQTAVIQGAITIGRALEIAELPAELQLAALGESPKPHARQRERSGTAKSRAGVNKTYVRKLLETVSKNGAKLTSGELAILGWFTGDVDNEHLVKAVPALARYVDVK